MRSEGVGGTFETWDVQRQEDDTVIVVHPHRDDWLGKF